MDADADVVSLYTSQAYTHRRTVGPIRLEIIPGKGLGWRAVRDVAPGELMLASLPLAVLYGSPGEPPDGEELAAALRQRWSRMTPYERRWLTLLADCAAASGGGSGVGASGAGVASGSDVATAVRGEPAPAPSAASLLDRAQELLQSMTVLDLEADRVVTEAAPEAGASQPGAEPLTGLTAAPLSILPPTIFGSEPAGAGGGAGASVDAAAAASTAAASRGGAIADLVGRYSFCEPREDPAVADLLDLDPDLNPVPGSNIISDPETSPSDVASSPPAAGGGSAASVAGLWPEAALLNHSCCPNGAVLLLGGAMYVRAGRALMEGEELTVSYLSKGLFQDVAERRRQLRARHGFLCRCPRCTAEQEHFPTRRYPELERQHQHPQPEHPQKPPPEGADDEAGARRASGGAASTSGDGGGGGAVLDDATLAATLMGRRGRGPLQRLLDLVFGPGRFRTNTAPDHRLLAGINAALISELEAAGQAVLTAASRPRQQQAALLARLEGLLKQVEASCNYLELPPRGRLLTYASVYGLVRLTCELAELSQQADPETRLALLTLAAEVLEAAAPGSDAHVTAAVKAASAARRVHGTEGPAARAAELAAGRSHVARYGRGLLSAPGLLRRMAATRQRLATGSSLAAAMGVLAWVQQVEGEA